MISMGLESHIGLQGYYGALLVSGALFDRTFDGKPS